MTATVPPPLGSSYPTTWALFPCARSKAPLTPHGHLDAVAGEAATALFAGHPGAQVGVAAGASDLLVIDLDVDDTKNGMERLRAELGDVPLGCGLIASTPRGGRHLIYRMPKGQRFGSRTDLLGGGSGIDVKADGGYVLVPSPASPDREWLVGDPNNPDDLIEPPEHVLELLRRYMNGGQVAAGEHRASDIDDLLRNGVDQGARNQGAARVAGHFLAHGHNGSSFELLSMWNETRVRPPLDEKELRRTFESVLKRDQREHPERHAPPVDLVAGGDLLPAAAKLAEVVAAPPAPPFPAHLLDGDDAVSRMAQWIDRTALQPQPAFALAAAIATVGAILGRCVESPTRLRTNFYCVTVGPTACGKGHSHSAIPRILHAAGLPQFVGSNRFRSGTAVRSLLLERPSVVCPMDEIGHVLQAALDPRAPAHLREMAGLLLTMFSAANGPQAGDGFADRKANPDTTIYEPHLCILGTATQASLHRALGSASVDDGFVGRWLMFDGVDRPERRLNGVGGDPSADLVAQVRDLAARTRPPGDLSGCATTASGCRRLSWGPGAEQAMRDLYVEGDARRQALRGAGLDALYGRFEEHAAKLALLRTVAGDPEAQEITADAMVWGRWVALWCLERTVLAVEGHVADSPHQGRVQRLWRLIHEAGADGLSKTDLARRTQAMTARERGDAIATLREAQRITEVECPSPRDDGRGRPTTRYVALGDR